MEDIPTGALIGVLIFLLLLSAFFSGSETGLMTLNRYRLKHLARAGHPGAMRAQQLLERPDRLIGLILLCNNVVNILAASLATILAQQLWGATGVALVWIPLTLVVLIFSEVTPKTLAALHPERIAFPAAFFYRPMLFILYPFVWMVNWIANRILRLFGVNPEDSSVATISSEELRTVVMEAGAMIPKRHRKMLLNLLDLEKVTVEDIMVPRSEIAGIDLKDDWDEITHQLTHTQYTRLPVFEESIDHVVGVLHVRNVAGLLREESFNPEDLRAVLREAYFIPEATSLNRQLLNFQRERRRTGLVVDEYGEIQGLVTLGDILEEIVGEFTTDPSGVIKEITAEKGGSYLVDAAVSVRELNRALRTQLPTNGPKTLNGLVLEYMETIPEPGTSLLLAGYPVDIVQTSENAVKTARLHPAMRRPLTEEDNPK